MYGISEIKNQIAYNFGSKEMRNNFFNPFSILEIDGLNYLSI